MLYQIGSLLWITSLLRFVLHETHWIWLFSRLNRRISFRVKFVYKKEKKTLLREINAKKKQSSAIEKLVLHLWLVLLSVSIEYCVCVEENTGVSVLNNRYTWNALSITHSLLDVLSSKEKKKSIWKCQLALMYFSSFRLFACFVECVACEMIYFFFLSSFK